MINLLDYGIPDIVIVVIFAFIVTLVSNIVLYFTVDKHKMRSIKERMEKLKKKSKDKEYLENKEKYKELLNEQYSLLHEQMRLNFKSMLINLVLLVPIYYYLKTMLQNTAFLLPFKLPFIGTSLSWIFVYLFYILLFSVVIKKLLKLEY